MRRPGLVVCKLANAWLRRSTEAGAFVGDGFNTKVQHAHLVFVDRRLILGLEAGYVLAHLSKFESAFATKRKDDIASQLSQPANLAGDGVLLDHRQVREPRGLTIRSRTY